MKNIILIGMMGCGKTTVGRLLSKALNREQVDTDQLIEARVGCSVSQIFALSGEEYFRGLELEISLELAEKENLVVSCGGGLPLRRGCADALASSGLIFWLDRDPGETYDSLDTSGRPLAQQGRAAFVERYQQRAPLYRAAAHHIIRADSPEQAARAILNIVEGGE